MRANAPLAIALGGVACLCGFVLFGPLVSRGVADDAGVMSFLLGESARRSASPRPSFGFFPRQRADVSSYRAPQRIARVPARARIILAAKAPKPVARKAAPVIVAIAAPPRPMPAVHPTAPVHSVSLSPLTDRSLRRGDAVMTSAGIRVFQGARHYPFDVGDFRPLAFAGNVPHRGALLAIDHALNRPTWSVSFTPASPVAAMSRPSVEAQTIRVVETPRRS